MSKSKKLRFHRRAAARRQFNHCYYCGASMWECTPPSHFLQFAKSARKVNRLRCTGEHLLPRSEGGRDTAANIVAACVFCNGTRHRAKRPLEPNAYQRYVRSRMAKGRWHPEWVHRLAAASALV